MMEIGRTDDTLFLRAFRDGIQIVIAFNLTEADNLRRYLNNALNIRDGIPTIDLTKISPDDVRLSG
jgi:hypothetical protein